MSHRFQRIGQFNNAELHPYPSQYNPCQKVTVRLRPLLAGCCLPVDGVNIWPVGRGNHGCLPVVTSWHTLQIGLYIWSVGVFLTQRNYAWALAVLSSYRMWARDRCKWSLHQWPRTGAFGVSGCVVLTRDMLQWVGQNSSRKSLAPRHGQCHGNYVLQCLPCAPRGAAPPNKRKQIWFRFYRLDLPYIHEHILY